MRSEEVNVLAERVAARTHLSKTEAVRRALESELRRLDAELPLRERLRPIQARVAARPPTGLAADRAFYDDLRRGGLMFVDLVGNFAMITGEPDGDMLANVLDAAKSPITSPIAFFRSGFGHPSQAHVNRERSRTGRWRFPGGGKNSFDFHHRGRSRGCVGRLRPLRQGPGSSGPTQSRRLLRLRSRPAPRRAAAVQGRRFRQDRHSHRPHHRRLNGRGVR